MMEFIKGAQRVAEPRGVKGLFLGPPGVGKTSLLHTLSAEMLASTLFIEAEAGDLAVRDLDVDTLHLGTWPEYRDIAVLRGGSNPSVPPDAVYSQAHHDTVMREFGEAWPLDKYTTFFIDSLTAVGRLCFAWACQQPEAFSDRSGKKDLRGAYGLHAREMCSWLTRLQHIRWINVFFVGVLETAVDDFGNRENRLQMEGARVARELPAIIDEVITYNWITFPGDDKPIRSFICTSPNPWQYPAKDRSGRLDQIEEPHLGKLLEKLSSTKPSGDLVELHQEPHSESEP
jgi:hypothetical protein